MRSHSFVSTAFALAVGLTAFDDGQLARAEPVASVASPSVMAVVPGKEKARRLGRSAGVAGLLGTAAHDGVFVGSAIGADATAAIDQMVASLGRPAPRLPHPVTPGSEPAVTAMKLDTDGR